tara:strand:+ start:2731 stop:3846 length:1116 start_codon:yes stop_codon:yes gene_type:complete
MALNHVIPGSTPASPANIENFGGRMIDIGFLERDGFEEIISVIDRETGLDAYIAIHSTKLGPSLGGLRIWDYDTPEKHLKDCKRLAEGMTYKNSLAGLDLGGGKAVINLNGQKKTPEMLQAFGEALNTLNGQYITAEDVGSTLDDMLEIKKTTAHVSTVSGAGDPSPATAFGVLVAMQAATEYYYNMEKINTVAIQGLGAVGMALAEMLYQKGVRLWVADIDESKTEYASKTFGASVVDTKDIHTVEVDVFAPCALGAILNAETIPELGAQIVCGSANNQLENPATDSKLFRVGSNTRYVYDRSIYIPDFLANAGGVINCAREFGDVATDFHVASMILDMKRRVYDCLSDAEDFKLSTHDAAMELAIERLK